MSFNKKLEHCPALPAGWMRAAVRRVNGVSAGKLDVYYVSPAGKKIRSKQELIREIGDTVDLSSFDYTGGKMGASLIRPGGKTRKPERKTMVSDTALSSNLNQLIPPIRQTASIFKQPVTVYKAHEAEVKKNLRNEREKPRQLFWEKRLSNISPNHTAEERLMMQLPRVVKELEWLQGRSSTTTLLASISTALHLDKKPVVGQTLSKQELEENPVIHLNPEQPLVGRMDVSDQDIQIQELRVIQARSKLAQAVKALG